MSRFWLFVLLAALAAGTPAFAAPAAAPDLFTVSGIKVDASAESATAARDIAMTQGRPAAWTKLYRRLTAASMWAKQPQLDDNALLRLIRSFEVAGERRSTTRYLAEVIFHFNPVAVRAALRQANIAYTDTRSRPALVIPVIAGKPGFDPMSPWAMAWNEPVLQQGLVPFVLPLNEAPEDAALLSRPDLGQLDWATLAPLARRHNVAAVIVASASEDAKSVQMVQITAAGRTPSSFAYAQSTFPALAEVIADRAAEIWKTRASVDFATRARLTADVSFDSLDDWSKIRDGLGSIRAVSGLEVVGLALHEAEINVTYSGRQEQLRDALAQQNLQLSNNNGQFSLQIAGATAANSQ
ncbi:MAG TPA: DUF2066 domain-containing protein [Micropepsaceae bacterium]|nr:DUF2066 domain-containing protein [Micropepsaceae bacterium]